MSGGAFDYQQYRLGEIADDIEKLVKHNGLTRTQLHEKFECDNDEYYDSDYYSEEEHLHRFMMLPPMLRVATENNRGYMTEVEAREYIKEHNEEKPVDYPEDIIEEFKTAVALLRKAQVYVQRIDWLVSGDDGYDSFRKRLNEDLEKLES